MHIVWFKRDLRLADNEALAQAAKLGSVLPLYILEPKLWRQADMSQRHYEFLQQCLAELDRSLRAIGQQLVIKVGDAVEVLQALSQRQAIEALWSHQETWNGWTYARDKAVLRWCRAHNIPWREPVQNGVIRSLQDRDGWSAKWYGRMQRQLMPAPARLITIDEQSERLPSASELGLRADDFSALQSGGRAAGLEALHSFLHERGEGYTKEMSSPVTAFSSCSRLSTHLAFGTLSMREVSQACEARSQELRAMPRGSKGTWPSAMRSFSGRLRWHCHFIQKLEDEPRIEFANMHAAYDGLRGEDNTSHLKAWQAGMTGYPMVDACMRALRATGWINFRMRAMLMSFASYHLWLHWRQPALHLARMFTDYEPGIHYSQVQMQSGTTGINAVRIYNPIKQGLDHDPEGEFIRRWIPELRDMPSDYLHRPWEAPAQMGDYPLPIVEEKVARKAAADKIYGLRKNNPEHKAAARKIVSKHGSRKGSARTASRSKAKDSAHAVP